MTAGEVPGHPHHTVLVDEFHDQNAHLRDQLPTVYPALEALVHMASLKADTDSGIFLDKNRSEEEQREWKKKRRQLFAAACRRTTSIRQHSIIKNMHALGMGGPKPSRTLAEFIQISVHGQVAPDRNIFTGQKRRISCPTPGQLRHAKKNDISDLTGADRMSRSTQTGPKTSLEVPPPPPAKPPSSTQKILYNGVPMPIHRDALDLVPDINFWKFDYNAVSCMVPVETPRGTPKSHSRSVKARRSVTHLIKNSPIRG